MSRVKVWGFTMTYLPLLAGLESVLVWREGGVET